MASRFLASASTATVTAAAAVVAAAPASADPFINGSFELDSPGATSLPTGYTDLQDGITAAIVTGGATDGSQALSFSIDAGSGGFYQGLKQTVFAADASADLIEGAEYRVQGDVAFNSGSNAYIRFNEYDLVGGNQFADSLSFGVTANQAMPTVSLDQTFVYRGGAVEVQFQIDSYGADPGSAIYDNFRVTPVAAVPEPASLAVLGLLGVAGLRRRR